MPIHQSKSAVLKFGSHLNASILLSISFFPFGIVIAIYVCKNVTGDVSLYLVMFLNPSSVIGLPRYRNGIHTSFSGKVQKGTVPERHISIFYELAEEMKITMRFFVKEIL